MELDLADERVVVTGGAGFLGCHTVEALKARGVEPAVIRSHNYDLRSLDQVEAMYRDFRPTVVFHLAAEVGGILANRNHPGRFFYNNLIMGAFLIDAGRRYGIKKFVSVGTVCSYPKITEVPFREDAIWDGYPEETNAPYGLAKKMQLVQLEAYHKEYGTMGIHLLPSNLYGPKDHFDPENGHVIPAIILKIEQAMRTGTGEVTLWGDGSPTREFLYAADCAEGLCLAAEQLESPEPVNLGTGVETSIREVAQTIAELMGFEGKIHWDTSKPNGQPRRSLNTQKAQSLFGFHAATSLRDGLKNTIEWYRTHSEQVRSGARGHA